MAVWQAVAVGVLDASLEHGITTITLTSAGDRPPVDLRVRPDLSLSLGG